MIKKRTISIFIYTLILIIPCLSFARTIKTPKQRTVQAVRTNGEIKVDGILSEEAWKSEGFGGFVQSDPHDGEDPTEKTLVWLAYDDQAIYVAARMFDSVPEKIKCRLGRRDDFVESDWFIFAVDPYYDRRSGYQFAVNPSGSIVDWTLYNDISRDTTWDGVWEYSTMIDDKGWTVELKIPFHQLRFPKKDEYTWGVNFRRQINRKNEKVGLVWVPKEDTGYVSHFAKLIGIKSISPGRHIEFLPYTVAQGQFSPEEEGNPFQTGENLLANVGFNAKIGLKSNLTLDTTVNPDFGQVEVDPAVINLSAYETYFQEKRPFFIEGSNIFNDFGRGGITNNMNINWSAPSFFYSRRVGRAPQGYVTRNGYVKYPDRSTILGAFKLTGKLGGKWNIGFLNALTAREFAEVDVSGSRFQEEVEPFSYYGALRAQREFNQGHQGLGVMATSVVRDLRNDNLSGILNQKALSFAFDGWAFLDKEKTWVLSGWMGGTYVNGSKEAIYRLQQSSLHYFQRPDASHVSLNENATSLSGWGGRFQLNKQRGRLLFNFALGALSPGFDPNDTGFQSGSSDIINSSLIVGYTWPHPGKVFRNLVVLGGPFGNYDFGGNKIWEGYLALANGQFLNYWGFETMAAYNPESISNDLTRGGPLVRIPPGWQLNTGLNTDRRKQFVFTLFSSVYKRPSIGTYNWNASTSVSWKPRSNISFSIGPNYMVQETGYQWIRKVDDSLMTDTFAARYIFGHLYQRVLSMEIRLNWTFTPKLTLQLYLQPFLAVGEYDRFKELARPKSFEFNTFGEGQSSLDFKDNIYWVDPDGEGPASVFTFNNPDFNFKSVRGTIVLRWEYHPGSILYFVWTQNRSDYANPGDFNFSRDLGDLFSAPGDNIFLLKATFRWNM